MKKGLLIVNTGDGKGKSTAAFGMILRAWGRGMRICVIQFIKASTGRWGEVRAARKLGIEWHTMGDGFVRNVNHAEDSACLACQGWELAQEKIASGAYDLLVLDEFTYPLALGWLETGAVLDWLRSRQNLGLHIVITGRSAPEALIREADLVTNMQVVKHPYQQGLKAQPGIEF